MADEQPRGRRRRRGGNPRRQPRQGVSLMRKNTHQIIETSGISRSQLREDKLIEYHNYRQTSISVEEFTNEFDRLRLRCDVVEEDEETIARYLAALKHEIFDVVQLQYRGRTSQVNGVISVKALGILPMIAQINSLLHVEEDDGPVFDEYDNEHEKMTSDLQEITYADSGKIYNVIIDSGSCENVVSETVM
ncbi:hypothetical protein Tco_0897771, partial [Tanacetum coccineum]